MSVEKVETQKDSLQRPAILNMAYGLYEVVPDKIYQVRGFDLANMTIIKGDTGWILFDVLTCKETAKAALELVNQHLGQRPVVAVIYSHSHVDHFGGVRGVVDEVDVKSGKVQVIAPVDFMEHAIAENVYTGNAMTRRAYFQYGLLLPRSPFGHVDQSIGKNAAAGLVGLIEPNHYISQGIEELTIDGVRMVFQNTPGTEAPAEMNTYFPDWKAFWAAENICGTIHNIYTLRGALVRDALEWSKKISEALYLFGQEAEVMFASHSWPRWGNDRIQETLIPLSPSESAPLYVEMMGGAEKILAKGRELYDQGKYREAMEILNKLVYAEPQNQTARDLLADVFEQIGYQKESPSVRNSFLSAAYELRNGFPSGVATKSVTPDTVRAMSTELLLDFITIRVDSQKVEGMKFIINLVTPDNGEKFAVEMSNATLTNLKGFQVKNPDLTLTINRSDVELIMAGLNTFPCLIAEGKVKLEGNPGVLEQLKSVLVEFTPDFDIMPGTKPAKMVSPSDKDVFEQPEPANTSGG